MERAAVGFRVKSGWAMAVLLGGPATAPRVLDSRKVALSDPADPEALQPYHPGLGIHGARGTLDAARLVAGVKRYARSSLAGLFRAYGRLGPHVAGVGIVAGSLVDPATIANDHIRAHAEEGRLFREVIQSAVKAARLRALVVVERELFPRAAVALRRPERQLKQDVAIFGAEVEGPWRAEQKAAALAAWMVLGSPKAGTRR